jgi:hypothetical protein
VRRTLTSEASWLLPVLLALLVAALIGWTIRTFELQAQRDERCQQQHASVMVLRLFLDDHLDLREQVPPTRTHAGTLARIDRLLDEADCNP